MPELTDQDPTSVLAGIGRYECPVCGVPADSLAEKKGHVRREHPRSKRKVRRG